MKGLLNPGAWVREKSKSTEKKQIGVIAQHAPYMSNKEHYMIYWFTKNGDYVGCNFCPRSSLKPKKNAPKVSDQIFVIPHLLTAAEKGQFREDPFQSGFVDLKNKYVVIDTQLVAVPAIANAIIETAMRVYKTCKIEKAPFELALEVA